MRRQYFFYRLFVFIVVVNSTVERQLHAENISYQRIQWGFWERAPGWNFQCATSDSCCIQGKKLDGRVSIRGQFDSLAVSMQQDVLFAGTLYLSGCEGLEFRYGVFYHDNAGELEYDGTDSAGWSGWNSNAWGYLFLPPSGNQQYVFWGNGGYGSIGVVQNGKWMGTFGNASSLGIVRQNPRNAILTNGKYLFAILIKKAQNGTKYIRFYLVKDERILSEQYLFMGESIEDTTRFSQIFNGICFALIGQRDESTTFSISNISILYGNDLQLPSLPQWYTDVYGMYIVRWGAVEGYSKGWKFIRESYIGDVSIQGEVPLTDTLVLLGEFTEVPSLELKEGQAYRIKGSFELVGSGFEGNRLKIGILYTDTIGILQQIPEDSTHWVECGTRYRGYMMVPPSGTHDLPVWGNARREGTLGAIVNEECKRTEGFNNYSLSAQRQEPLFAIGTEGYYQFGISIVRWSDHTIRIKGFFIKSNGTYRYVVDAHDAGMQSQTAKFNCFVLVYEPGNTIQKINLRDVFVQITYDTTLSMPTHIMNEMSENPKQYVLYQNYPNPFNPTTTITYSIPNLSHVKLCIYDVLGRTVATLVDEIQPTNRYIASWNASCYSTGVYFCRLVARSIDNSKYFTCVRKLVYVK